MRAHGKLHKSFYPKRSQDELQSDIETHVNIRHNQYGMPTNIPLIFPKSHEHMNLVVRTLQEKSTEHNGVGPELVRFSFLVIQTHLLMLMRSVRIGAKTSMVINKSDATCIFATISPLPPPSPPHPPAPAPRPNP